MPVSVPCLRCSALGLDRGIALTLCAWSLIHLELNLIRKARAHVALSTISHLQLGVIQVDCLGARTLIIALQIATHPESANQ